MTHDSCSYIVSAVPLPFIKQYPSPPHTGISVLSLFYPDAVVFHFILLVLVLFPSFRASSKVLLSSTVSSALTSLARLEQILLCSRGCWAGVGGVMFGAQKLQDGAAVDSRRRSPAPTSKLHFCLNIQQVTQKKPSQMMKELYSKASTHAENPPKALQTLFSHAL